MSFILIKWLVYYLINLGITSAYDSNDCNERLESRTNKDINIHEELNAPKAKNKRIYCEGKFYKNINTIRLFMSYNKK